MTDTTRFGLLNEVLLTQANPFMQDLIGSERLDETRLELITSLYFIGGIIRFGILEGLDDRFKLNIDVFTVFVKETFKSCLPYSNGTFDEAIYSEFEIVLKSFLGNRSTENFWPLYKGRWNIMSELDAISFTLDLPAQLIELIIRNDGNTDIPGDPTIFPDFDARELSIYKELYPNVFI